jgi:hypothetical protein
MANFFIPDNSIQAIAYRQFRSGQISQFEYNLMIEQENNSEDLSFMDFI